MRVFKRIQEEFQQHARVQHIVYVSLLVIIAVATHWQWFNPHSILTFGDWQYRPTESVRQMFSSWQTWVPFEGLGSVNILMSGFPFRGLAWSAVTNLGLSYDIATKLTLFIPAAIGGFITAYILGVRLFKDRFIAFVAAIFYGTTPYYLSIQAGHLPINIIYLLTPLMVYVLDKALYQNQIRQWVTLALLYSVGIFYEVRIMYIVTIILGLYAVGYVWSQERRLLPYLKSVAVFGILVVAINLFWLIPTKLAAGGTIGEVAGRGLFGDSLFSLAQSFAVMKWNWTGAEVNRAFSAQPVLPYMWAVPAVAFSAVLFAKKYMSRAIVFLLLSLIGILLTKQSAEPFSGLYGWLYNNFPGFVLFREASKFYLLVAFGYFGLIGYALKGMKHSVWYRHKRMRPVLYTLSIVALLSVSAVNLWPAANGTLSGTFRNNEMPADYKVFKQFVEKQPDFFRVYWLPRESWWGYYDNQHPRVRAIDIVEQNWAPFVAQKGGDGYEIASKNAGLLQQPFSENLFSNASVKYVVVPIRDVSGNEDFFPSYGNDRQYYIEQLDNVSFLRRINIGTQDLAVYENKQYRPYINASTSIYLAKDSKTPNDQANIITSLKGDFSTDAMTPQHQAEVGLGSVDTLFDADNYNQQKQQAGSTLSEKSELVAGSYLQVGQRAHNYSYSLAGSTLSLYQEAGGKLLSNGVIVDGGDSRQRIGAATLPAAGSYYVSVGNTLAPLSLEAGEHRLGVTAEALNIYRGSGTNVIRNASFEDGTWGTLQDCNDYDNNPLVSAEVPQGDATDGQHSLALYAQRHTACMKQADVPVAPGAYAFRMDYRNEHGQQVGYTLTFNDPAKTTINKQVRVSGQDWRSLWQRVTVPAGATRMTITIKGYPGVDQTTGAVTYYDNMRMEPLASVVSRAASTSSTEKIALGAGPAIFAYTEPDRTYTNAIGNPSFEDGTWQKEVGDCHNYDSKPSIKMSIDSGAFSGSKSLLLSASRHIACTDQPDITVQGASQYFFGFSFKANNTAQVRYRLVFNDPAKTTIDTNVQVDTNNKWQTYTRDMETPLGATSVSLTIYATPNAYGKKDVSVRYDNFQLVEIPPVTDVYHVITPPMAGMKAPASATYITNQPTKKTVQVSAATTPFYLMMNEAYDSHWALSGVPGLAHFKVSGGVNAWYVDPAIVCKAVPDRCDDRGNGSYDMDLTVSFTPQRIFTYGLLISGVTFVGCAVYALAAWRMDRAWRGRPLWK